LQALNGAEIFLNGSGSHHNLRKLQKRLDLIRNATDKSGGVYLYANQQGCDGGRLYYDGCALVACNGDLLAQGSQFSVHDVEVVCAVVDLESVRSFRAATVSRNIQAARARRLPRVRVDFALCKPALQLSAPTPSMAHARIHCAEEEIAYGPACWLWDFLRRSGAGGFFLPLSGGADSAATATIVGVMCQLVVRGCATGDSQVINDARRVAGAGPSESNYVPTDAREFCRRVFHTCYMGTQNSTAETRARAAALANDIGSYHMDTDIDSIVTGFMTVVQALLGKAPRFKVYGGSETENLALQNIQARSRMVLSYLLAQLLPWARGTRGYLLVLGSANVDEALRGYLTKYDCSSADINPIGGISKEDLKSFMSWAARACNMPSLSQIVEAKASAELEPQTEQHKQVSEEDMGLTFAELGVFGRLRKMARSGPVSMFQRVRHVWTHLSPSAVADKVKRFFTFYASNRHKVTTLTPSYHAENYSPEDNRYDHRQFLYHTKWPRQFATIDRLVPLMEAQDKQAAALAQQSNTNDTQTAVTASGSGVTRRAAL
jgi:NAD+ synthase (glutamine-hydrolysing)